MKNSERAELHIEGDTVCLRDNNIIHVVATGLQSNELAVEMKKVCMELNSRMEGKCNYLIDINLCGKNEPGARSIWKELAGGENTHKAAIFGMNPVSRLIANFVIGTYSKTNMRFFKSEEEAVDWLGKIDD